MKLGLLIRARAERISLALHQADHGLYCLTNPRGAVVAGPLPLDALDAVLANIERHQQAVLRARREARG